MSKQEAVVAFQDAVETRKMAFLVQMASGFDSRVYVETESVKVNAKSLIGMMGLALQKGDTVTVITEGEDEEEALKQIVAFIEEK